MPALAAPRDGDVIAALAALASLGGLAVRPKATAPAGRVTMAEAAELAGVSKSAVQRRIAHCSVPARTEPDGVVTIARGDVKLIAPREPADDTCKAVMVRVPRDRYKLWARAAKKRGMPVSTWLAELADQAVEG